MAAFLICKGLKAHAVHDTNKINIHILEGDAVSKLANRDNGQPCNRLQESNFMKINHHTYYNNIHSHIVEFTAILLLINQQVHI
jgi:hypothetical protein